MRFVQLACIMSVCALAWAQRTTDDLVASALKESSGQYQMKMLEATKLGAQSKVRGAKSTPLADKIGEISTIYLNALNILTTRHNIDKEEALKLLAKQAPGAECQKLALSCDEKSEYRTMDGTCNNLKPNRERWGAANMPFRRLGTLNSPLVEYEGNNEPRGGKDSALPNARNISLEIHYTTSDEDDIADATITHMVPQFGQFLDHDITLTPEGGVACCSMAEGSRPDNCFPIEVDAEDQFYKQYGVKCLDFTRSNAFCPTETGGFREQMNAITAFIDGSQVYGSDKRVMKMLREFKGGRLEGNSEHKGFLPWTSDVDPAVQTPGRTKAGDVRSDEMPGLAVMHTLFHREHNRIAEYFENNTDWSDEKIFQETRRIIIAELQQVTYNEFLPVILGPTLMEDYKLNLPEGSTQTAYDSEKDPTIFNSFAVAAYRFGHTMVNGLIKFLINESLGSGYPVKDQYFNASPILRQDGKGFDYILGGLITQTSLTYDGEFSQHLTNHLFKSHTANFGSDLAARNIQRGRDHGTPGYYKFREFCDLPALPEFETNLPDNIPSEAWEKLGNVYEESSDIDLYTGGLVETRVPGGQSGSTFACLMGLQFQRLKDGDRFFFTHKDQTGSFTEKQLLALRKRTLGDIICENSDISRTAANVFKIENDESKKISCTDPSRKLNIGLFSSSAKLINMAYMIILPVFSIYYTQF